MTEPTVAVLIPCRDEEPTVAEVVTGFRGAFPNATVYVYGNGSTDDTAVQALHEGAVVAFEPLPGKGRVLRRMFANIDADVYDVADGDGTYDPAEAPAMAKRLLDDGLDMVVGIREAVTQDAERRGRALGNRLFNRLYRVLFGLGFSDILGGYRVVSRRFVKSFPSVSSGFEIETELAVHTSQLGVPFAEVPVNYGIRPEGSVSNLRTFADGLKILRAMIVLLKENRPLLMFGSLAAACFAWALILAVPLAATYVQTGLVPRFPTAVLATGLVVLSMLLVVSDLILDTAAKARIEVKRLAYLSQPS